jgi:hypothetical protein
MSELPPDEPSIAAAGADSRQAHGRGPRGARHPDFRGDFGAGPGKVNGAPAVTPIPIPRIHYLARCIHSLGERPLAELFTELAAGRGLHDVLERYARLAPVADFIRALGGDRLLGPRAVREEPR